MRATACALGMLLAAGCAGPAQDDPEGLKLAKMIQDSQQEGFGKHDLKKYLSIWSDDAKLIEGRTAKPDKYDTVLTLAQLEATRKLRFAVPAPKGITMEFKDVHTEVKGDEATVRYRATIRFTGGSETADEVFRLRRKDGEWKVYENRSWPVERRGSDFIEMFEEGTWKVLDDQAARAATLGEQVAALNHARRFAEAHARAKEWTAKESKNADAWVTRGQLAMEVGDVADAKASFRKALAVEARVNLPAYARKAAE